MTVTEDKVLSYVCCSAVGIATDYGRDRSGRPRSRSSSPGRGKIFSLPNVVQTGSGVHPTYLMSTGGSFSEVKQPRREANHSPQTSSEVKNTWIYTATPKYVFMA
jgi:hypothetical protein